VAIELTHNYGTEKEGFTGYHPGNQERDGFGHLAVRFVIYFMDFKIKFFCLFHNWLYNNIKSIIFAYSCDDVYASCLKLEQDGVVFKKKPDEGR